MGIKLLNIIRKKQKSCPFCSSHTALPPNLAYGEAGALRVQCYINNNAIVVRMQAFKMGMQRMTKINYCPMCGRKLK